MLSPSQNISLNWDRCAHPLFWNDYISKYLSSSDHSLPILHKEQRILNQTCEQYFGLFPGYADKKLVPFLSTHLLLLLTTFLTSTHRLVSPRDSAKPLQPTKALVLASPGLSYFPVTCDVKGEWIQTGEASQQLAHGRLHSLEEASKIDSIAYSPSSFWE